MNENALLTNVLRPLALIRAFFYLYATVEAIALAYLYYNAYKKYKTTPIIKAVQSLLLAVGIFFFFMVIVALLSFLDSANILYHIIIAFTPLVVMPIIYALIEFRQRSTDEVEKDGQHLVSSYKLKK